MTISGVIGILLGGINIFIISSAVKGNNAAFFQNEKSVFIVAFIICLAMCSVGINNMLGNHSFRIAGFISGGIIGIMLLVLFFSVVSGSMSPMFGSVRNSLIALLVLMAVKLTISTVNIIYLAVSAGGR